MKDKGITFDIINENDAQTFLEDRNYYLKLASYRSNYKKDSNTGKYINLDFAYLRELSALDKRLRYVIIQMVLDIEHNLKVNLLNHIENNPEEDGYKIIQKFLAEDSKLKILSSIQRHKSSIYCKNLIEKYYPYFPVWVFVELISFGELTYLCEFYNKLYNYELGDRILLNSVRDIRNACAHSNCLINNLVPGNNIPHQSVVNRVKRISTIGANSRDKKLKNKFIYDFICLLFAYDEIIINPDTKKERINEIKLLMSTRFIQNKDWFLNNNIITSSYSFINKALDYFIDK